MEVEPTRFNKLSCLLVNNSVNRTKDGFTFKSDYDEYYLHVESNSNSQLEIRPYATEYV